MSAEVKDFEILKRTDTRKAAYAVVLVAMGVALATSMAFVTPLGHPVNILMLGPGGYRFRDFFKVGLPLTILLFIIVLVVLPIFWPFAVR